MQGYYKYYDHNVIIDKEIPATVRFKKFCLRLF